MNEMQLRAYAKINLGLDVLGKREDGYHDVRMIMQSVRLFDKIVLRKSETDTFRLKTNSSFLPVDDNNLMVKSARLMFEEYAIPGGLSMELMKHIPVAAGLAGGSSDAAAVIFGINRMYQLGLSLEEMMEQGVRIGADVPFCLMRGTAIAEGIGEKLSRLPSCPKCYIVLAKPSIFVSTKLVYKSLDMSRIEQHPDIDAQLRALRDGDIEALAAAMGNVLETVTIPMHPVIQEIKDLLVREGALNAMMSGSGPTVFAIFRERETAEHAAEVLTAEKKLRGVRVTEVLGAG